MSIKLSITEHSFSPVAEQDLIDSAADVCVAYQDALEACIDVSELSQIVDNIAFARDSIKNHGAEWYIRNCDPENQFKSLFGTVNVKAAQEGISDVLKTVWEKIKTFFNKIFTWIKNIVFGAKSKAAEDSVKQTKAHVKSCKGKMKAKHRIIPKSFIVFVNRFKHTSTEDLSEEAEAVGIDKQGIKIFSMFCEKFFPGGDIILEHIYESTEELANADSVEDYERIKSEQGHDSWMKEIEKTMTMAFSQLAAIENHVICLEKAPSSDKEFAKILGISSPSEAYRYVTDIEILQQRIHSKYAKKTLAKLEQISKKISSIVPKSDSDDLNQRILTELKEAGSCVRSLASDINQIIGFIDGYCTNFIQGFKEATESDE